MLFSTQIVKLCSSSGLSRFDDMAEACQYSDSLHDFFSWNGCTGSPPGRLTASNAYRSSEFRMAPSTSGEDCGTAYGSVDSILNISRSPHSELNLFFWISPSDTQRKYIVNYIIISHQPSLSEKSSNIFGPPSTHHEGRLELGEADREQRFV